MTVMHTHAFFFYRVLHVITSRIGAVTYIATQSHTQLSFTQHMELLISYTWPPSLLVLVLEVLLSRSVSSSIDSFKIRNSANIESSNL
jgi:hypothetical protein